VHFPRELGHPKAKLYFECAEIYCCEGGRTVRICTIRTAEKWARFSRQGRNRNQGSLRIFVVERQSYRTICTTTNWHDFRGIVFLGGSYNNTDLARFSRHILGGTVWVL
jgi:hypothetical protein